MRNHDLTSVVYDQDSLERLSKLHPDQQANIESLIAYMRGSTFGTAILEPPFSEKVIFHPSLDNPKQAHVTFGKLRVRIARNLNDLCVTAMKR